MAECASVCEHVHLPAAVGLDACAEVDASHLLSRALPPARRSDCELRSQTSRYGTDLIVGFPGETEDDFQQTLSLVEEVRFDSAFTFVYSPRAGTEAATLPDQVSEEEKHERLERLVEVVQRTASERNAARIGLIEEVLVEGASRTDSDLQRGRTRRNTMVNFAGTATAGSIVGVIVEDATSTTLRGREALLVAV